MISLFASARAMAPFSLIWSKAVQLLYWVLGKPRQKLAWLLEHPGVQVVSRDRSKAYKAGINQGAPEAIQVAERFHLLQNLVETLDQFFNTHGQNLKAVEAAHSLSSKTRQDSTTVVPIALPCLTVKEQQRTQQRRTRRLSIYQQVWNLHRQGWTAQAIARDCRYRSLDRISLSPHAQLS